NMPSSQWRDKGKAHVETDTFEEVDEEETMRISQMHFGLPIMEDYYIAFKEKRAITEESRFDIDYFEMDFPDLAEQF
ncbi:hypothetical protein HAX54_037822, partial [Datura stramonium]|nr:hypothetical protein [Datura stramonium]